MVVATRRDLGQVRHAQHLTVAAELMQQASDYFGHTAANTRIHFVEDQGRRGACRARDHRERQADTREFAARRDFRERTQRDARMARDP